MKKEKLYIVLTVILLNVILAGCESNDHSIDLSKESHESESVAEETSGDIFVYVNGAVKNPGVYCVSSDARIYQVIDMAGGMTDKAQKNCLNLAEKVYDGQEIQVMTRKQFKKQNSKSGESTKEQNAENTANGENPNAEVVNINNATIEQLTSLPGIGNTKAAAIVAYREENGGFSSIEDLKNVSGIGDATFANIKQMITVN